MPSPYIIREFAEDTAYHIFNRGINRRIIFKDETDYKIFYYYLRIYLLDPELLTEKYPRLPLHLTAGNLNDRIDLLAYCFMPNHYHLLLYQKTKEAIPQLMKQLSNAYTQYFNKKYERIGGLLQGRYKAVRIESDEELIHVSRYIHLNPVVSNLSSKPEDHVWSSYTTYTGVSLNKLINTEMVMSHFNNSKDYAQFVLNQKDYAISLSQIKHLSIDL